jgi:hypothetical protein
LWHLPQACLCLYECYVLCHHDHSTPRAHSASCPRSIGAISRRKNGRSVTLTTHFYLLPSLRMGGAISPYPHTSLWYGVLTHGHILILPLICIRTYVCVYGWMVKVKLSMCFNWAPRHEGVLGEWRYSSTHSLTSALDGGEWSALHPDRFTLRERAPGTHWIGRRVGPRAIRMYVCMYVCMRAICSIS